jgi:hypothetical protein
VKPLERCQLKNWKEYLDYEIEQGDQERIIVLFERCLIACALYEEFWIKVSIAISFEVTYVVIQTVDHVQHSILTTVLVPCLMVMEGLCFLVYL